MDQHLRAAEALSLREYEVLLAIDDSPGHRLRRVDLAAKVLLTQSGVTRLLDKLERDDLVEKVADERDRRVAYAALTEEGRRRVGAAARTHHADIAALFTARLTPRDLAALDRVLAKLPGGSDNAAWRTSRRSI